MKKFEVGKRYEDGAMTFEVISRTAKFVTVKFIQHANKANESVRDVVKVKVNNWETEEVIFPKNMYEVHA